jgi:hypothetical protein
MIAEVPYPSLIDVMDFRADAHGLAEIRCRLCPMAIINLGHPRIGPF